MRPFEIELSDIKVKDLHIIILSASESLNPRQAQSFQSEKGTHFVLLHTILFRAILNQEKQMQGGIFHSWANIQSMSKDTRKVLAGNSESNFEFKNAAVAFTKQQLRAHHSFPLSRTEKTMRQEGILSRHLRRPGEHAHLCRLG